VLFTPAANYNGPASFTYTVQDNGTTNGSADPKTSTATASFAVTPVNDSPVARPDTALVLEGDIVTGNVIAGTGSGAADTDIDGDPLTVLGVSFPETGASVGPGTALAGEFGTLMLNADGSFSYTGKSSSDLVEGETGTDQFAYTIIDSWGLTSTTTLTVSVLGRNVVITNGSGDLFGSRGDDDITGNEGVNRIRGFGGNDELDGAGGSDQLWGDEGNDSMFGQSGNDDLVGADGDDTLRLGDGSDRGWGGNGNDSIFGEDGDDSLMGMDGDDTLDGGGGDDLVYGQEGNDTLILGDGNDWGVGGDGNDTINAGDGQDVVLGGSGDDTMRGDAGDDQMWGEAGDDTFFGGTGNDQYAGGTGNDTLNFDEGVETSWGGVDNDAFVFTLGLASGDVVQDFSGNGAADGDRFIFHGYGTAAEGASFTQVDATHWQIQSADGLATEVITLGNAASVHASDVLFV